MISDDGLWRLTSPAAAIACTLGAIAFGAWLLARRVERELRRHRHRRPVMTCGAEIEIEFEDGTFDTLRCSDRYAANEEGHGETHSCRVWWPNNEAPELGGE